MNALANSLKDVCPFAANGDCVLANADCKQVLPRMESSSAHVIIIDPPYGNQTQCNSTKTWDFKWNSKEWHTIVKESFRILKPGGHLIVFSGGKTLFDIHSEIVNAYKAAYTTDPSFTHMIWNHESGDSLTTHSHLPRSQFENIMVYWRTGEAKVMVQNGCLTVTERFFHHTGRSNVLHVYKDDCRSKPEKTVQEYFRVMDSLKSGTVVTFDMKPRQLIELLVRDYCKEGGVVIDFCMNHGITGMAALSLRRKFIGVEFDPHGFKLAKTRIEDYFKLSFDQQGYDGVEFSDTDTAPLLADERPLLADQEQEVQQMGLPSLFHCDECKNNITGIRYHKSGDCDLCVTCFESLSPSAQGEYTPASNCFYKRPRGRNKKGMLWDSTFGKWVSIGYEPTAAPTSTPKKRKQIHEATTEFVTTARVTRVTRSGY